MSDTPTVEQALLALSARDDDHAAVRNDVGFNGRDTEFGNSLADQIRRGKVLTPRQLYAAHRMLGTYRTQLSGMGIDYDAIPLPAPPPAPVTTRTVDLDRETFILRFEFNQQIASAIKSLPDTRRWNPDARAWEVQATDDNIVGLAAIVGKFRFTVMPIAQKTLDTAIAHAEAEQMRAEAIIAESIAASADYEVDGLGGELRPFQKAGVKYAVERRRTWIADEMGLGKTVQALATLKKLEAFPAIVVCPASLKANWRREAMKWLPGKRVSILSGKAPSDNASLNLLFSLDTSADVVIINYDILGSWVATLRARAPKAVIFDESHYIKTAGAVRTKASRELAKGSSTVLMLTGTPVLNRPLELLTQLQVMDRLGELGGYTEFRRKYVDVLCKTCGVWGGKHASSCDDPQGPNLRELNDRMRASCFIRRLKSQVLTELPPKQRAIVPIELSNMPEYEAAEGELVAFLMRHDPEKARTARLAEDLAHIEQLKQLVAKGKMDSAIEWVEDFLASGEKLVLFGWHRAVVEQLAERFDAPFIHGGTPLADRDAAVAAFQGDPKVNLIVGNMQAAGVGLTLTSASNVAFLELGWTPAVHDQAEDRCHRIGQLDSVTAHYLLAPLTIDERIQRLIDAKRLVVDATTDGRMAMQNQSIISDLIADLTHGKVVYDQKEIAV